MRKEFKIKESKGEHVNLRNIFLRNVDPRKATRPNKISPKIFKMLPMLSIII